MTNVEPPHAPDCSMMRDGVALGSGDCDCGAFDIREVTALEEREEQEKRITAAIDAILIEYGGGVAAWKDRDPPAVALAKVVMTTLDELKLEKARRDVREGRWVRWLRDDA